MFFFIFYMVAEHLIMFGTDKLDCLQIDYVHIIILVFVMQKLVLSNCYVFFYFLYGGGTLNYVRCRQVGLLTNQLCVYNYLSFCNAKIGEKLYIFSNGVVVSCNGHSIMQAAR